MQLELKFKRLSLELSIVVRPSLKLFENKHAIYDYTRIHNFSALKYENKCIRMMRPCFQFLRTSV
jgi:hypothetical protein